MEEIDVKAINETDVSVLYICSYGQTGIPICVDLGHEYCKLPNQKDKECNLRPVVSYRDYKQLKEQLKREEKEVDELLLAYHAVDDQRRDLEEHYKKLEDSLGLANKKVNQYYQALQEIKEIAQIACDKSICHNDCSICSDGNILQIISEVEE